MYRITLDSKAAEKAVTGRLRQIPFATSAALNRTADDINAELRRTIPEDFTIRAPQLLRFIAPVQLPKARQATKDRLEATLQSEKWGRVFNPFETGTPKEAESDERPVAVPTKNLRPNPRATIARSLYPNNLGIVKTKGSKKKGEADYYNLGRGSKKKALTPFTRDAGGNVTGAKGKTVNIPGLGRVRTYLRAPWLDPRTTEQQWGIWAYSAEQKKSFKLWNFTRRAKRPRSLQFKGTAARVFAQRYRINFDGAFKAALRTAR